MKREPRRPFRIRLGTALTLLMLLAVASTAYVVHYSWMRTANRNIELIVGSLHERTASSVLRELKSTFRSAEGAAEVIRSIFFQGVIRPADEAKREFVFLSVLLSQPSISWVGFGFPDGRFFGAHAMADGNFEMVEIGDFADESQRRLRRDLYSPLSGDIHFNQRLTDVSAYVTAGAKWYREARKANGLVWTNVDILPSGFEPAAVVAEPLVINGRFEGVIMVSLRASRISEFLSGLDIAASGAARIVDGRGVPLASSSQDLDAPLAQGLGLAAAGPATHDGSVMIEGAGEYFITSTPIGLNEWRLLTAIPRSAFTREIDRNTQRLALVIAGLAGLAAVTSALFAHLFIARHIRQLAGQLRHIESFALDKVCYRKTWLLELDSLSSALKRMSTSLSAFSLYVPTEVVRTLIDQGVAPRPGGETREITVMFADLPGFTELTERHGADVASFLTTFLTLATEAIHREGGTVDKFIGDCIMGIWNAPQTVEGHAEKACRAALAIRQLMQEVERPDGRAVGPRVRIGIATGRAFVGNVGSSQRLSYTALGDIVNIASRLEALGKELETEITVSRETAAAAGEAFAFRALGTRAIRGRKGSLDVFALERAASSPVDRPGQPRPARSPGNTDAAA